MKLKTRKSAAKRIKIKKTVYVEKKLIKGHLLRRKDSKRLRTLSSPSQVHKSDLARFAQMLPYA